MKKNLKHLALFCLIMTAVFTVSCNKGGDDGPIKGETYDLGNGSDAFEVKENLTLTYPNTYNLKGFVYVTDGATLTIEPGVIIKGDKETKGTIIVERGGKIMARGTKERPIVFTSAKAPGSRRPGDWGGIILLGSAKNNKGEMTIEGGVRSSHGGSNDADNSGVLSYVRIEFAGIEYSTNNEINGLTMGSVGSKTQIDHVQVSHSGDDSFEWFGGSVSGKYLVAFNGWDDDFDADNGFNGNVQFGLIVRDPEVADQSASNGFESDNNSDGAGEPGSLFTSAVFANISSFGPVTNPGSYTDRGSVHGSVNPKGVFQAAIQLRRSTKLSVFNSVMAGWPIGLIIENDKGTSQTWATNNELRINNVVLAGMQANFQDGATNGGTVVNASKGSDFVSNYFSSRAGNATYPAIADLKLSVVPIAIPQSGSPLLDKAAWTDSYVSRTDNTRINYNFDKVTYIGAFGPTETAASNWTSGWCNFDPQNTEY